MSNINTNTFTADSLTAKTINVSEILSFGIGYVGFDPTQKLMVICGTEVI